jgi:hypothetical protein
MTEDTVTIWTGAYHSSRTCYHFDTDCTLLKNDDPNERDWSYVEHHDLRPCSRCAEDHCRECGRDLGAGYLCDDCDEVVVHA